MPCCLTVDDETRSHLSVIDDDACDVFSVDHEGEQLGSLVKQVGLQGHVVMAERIH